MGDSFWLYKVIAFWRHFIDPDVAPQIMTNSKIVSGFSKAKT